MKIDAPFSEKRAHFCLTKHIKRLISFICFSLLFSILLELKFQVGFTKILMQMVVGTAQPSTLTKVELELVLRFYNKSGNLMASTTTDATGKYFIPSITGNVRVHLIPAAFYTDDFITKKNQGSQSSVQFIKAPATNIDSGMNYADDYCGDNPQVVVSCYVVSIGDVLTPNDDLALFDCGAPGTDYSQIRMPNVSISMIGSTWGGAYQKESGSFLCHPS